MDLIILGIVAVFLIFRLFSMIGQDLGGNTDAFSEMSSKSDKTFDINQTKEKTKQQDIIDVKATDKPKVKSTVVNNIKKEYPDFDSENFINGASHCFKNTVENFAQGNKDALKELLTPATYKVFAKVVDSREKSGETAKDEVVGFVGVKIVNAKTTGKSIDVEVEFKTDQINVVYDNQNRVIEGHPSDIVRITDNWVFTRDKKSDSMNWYVKETS